VQDVARLAERLVQGDLLFGNVLVGTFGVLDVVGTQEVLAAGVPRVSAQGEPVQV
jgi:hypothetical protein